MLCIFMQLFWINIWFEVVCHVCNECVILMYQYMMHAIYDTVSHMFWHKVSDHDEMLMCMTKPMGKDAEHEPVVLCERILDVNPCAIGPIFRNAFITNVLIQKYRIIMKGLCVQQNLWGRTLGVNPQFCGKGCWAWTHVLMKHLQEV